MKDSIEKDLIQKFSNGDPITDGELKLLIAHYDQLVSLLKPHGDIYRLVWLDCYHSLSRLQGYKEARKK